MIHKTCGILAAALFIALGPLGCTPKPKVPKVPEADLATPAPVRETAAARPPVSATPAPATPIATDLKKAAAHQALRIVAWNLEWFPGHKPTPTPDAEAQQMEVAKAALAELKPDVLLLEEVRDWESAAELCKAVPGMEVHVVSRFQPRPQNQVVASRFPADSTWSESWKADAVTPPRGYSFAALELPDHRFLLTYALHLKSNLGSLSEDIPMRQTAIRQLLQHANEMVALYSQRGPCAVVVGGDMNTSLDDAKFQEEQTLPALMKSGFHWTHEGVPFADRATIPAKGKFPDNCFDHIFTAGLGKPTAVVKLYPEVSDHNPVIVDVDLAQANFEPRIDPAPGIALIDQAPIAAPAPAALGTPMTPPIALEPTDTAGLVAAAGKPVLVQGRVQTVGNTKTNSIYFINFSGVPKGGFTAIVKQDHYGAIAAAIGGDLKAMLEGRMVEITGPVILYKDAPEVVITDPKQLRLVQ
jgi:endonuclease/exonuclease/phosphatase family metal-dependent hydrolase